MLEAPARVAQLISEFVNDHTEPRRATPPAG